jgi:5-methyltetrahydrofolate--homocysteine methyltransferase
MPNLSIQRGFFLAHNTRKYYQQEMKDINHKPSYLAALNTRVLVFNGAMGTNLARMGLTSAHFGGEKLCGCNDCLVLTSPGSVEKVHRSFLEVGVDVIVTNTFRANRITLAEYGIADQTAEINHSAALLARHLADEYSTPDHPRFVAGSLGPTGQLLSANSVLMKSWLSTGSRHKACWKAALTFSSWKPPRISWR